MTVAALTAVDGPADGAARVAARIAEIQALIAQARGVATAPPAAATAATNGGAAFAGALASATAAQLAPPVAAAAVVPGAVAPAVGGPPTPYDHLIVAAAQRHGIDPALLKGLIRAESNFDPTVTSPAGAAGLVQLMPGTAAALGVTDRFDPAQSIDAGARYLRQQLDAFGGDVTLALAAYNAGPGAVRRHGGVPPYAETQAYVQKVQRYAAEYRVAPAPTPALAAPAAPAYAAPSLPPTTGSGSIT